MGLIKPDLPPVDIASFLQQPLRERIRTLAAYWVEHGFGTPKAIYLVYIVKVAVLYVLGGMLVIAGTSGLGGIFEIQRWWNEPVVYQKAVVWTMLLEAIGVAGSWGPLAGKFKPMTGGILFFARPGTIRLPPWPQVPLTRGNSRTMFDVLLYVGLLAALTAALVLPGEASAALSRLLPAAKGGLIARAPVLLAAAFVVLCGLRDKTIALAARIEQYLPALVFFGLLPFADMIIALKLLIVAVWIGAGFSKHGMHFVNVLPPMFSNTPFWPPDRLKRAMYRNPPHDLRPSALASFLATWPAMLGEVAPPLVLLFTHSPGLALVAALFMVAFHAFIFSTFPLAVPLEWNVLFGAAAVMLFLGFPAWQGFALTDFSSPGLLAAIVAGLLFFPVLGNLRPDLVSFLPSMRQYAGNWASALWAFAPGAEARLDRVLRPTRNQREQLIQMGYPPEVAELTMQRTIAWRSMHSQGRGLFSLLYRALPDLESRTVREAEFVCNSLLGFNFGDGHLHDASMIAAVQERCGFAPGELVVVWVESQPAHVGTQRYQIIDAATGVLERGTWKVADAVNALPWLPDGPIPVEVEWRRAEVRPVTAGTYAAAVGT